jgi:hypothetical protein
VAPPPFRKLLNIKLWVGLHRIANRGPDEPEILPSSTHPNLSHER